MIEIDAIPAFPWFDEYFDSMRIPGETGVAISKLSSKERSCVSFGATAGECKLNVSSGEPFVVVRSARLSSEEYDRLVQLLDGPFRRDGIVAADMLDGVTYMVKWIDRRSSTRLVLSNPRHLDSKPVVEFVDKLDEILSIM